MTSDENGVESVERKTGQDVKQHIIWVSLSMTLPNTLTHMHQVYDLIFIKLPYLAKCWS
jgi:hypothetical protein